MAVKLYIDIVQNSQSIAGNTSNVSVSVRCKWSSGSYNKNSPGPAGWLKIDGVKYDFRNTFNDSRTSSGSKILFTKTLDVDHDNEGKKSITCSASFATGTTSSGTITASASSALTDIPRFTYLVSAPNFNDEEKPTITYVNPAGSNVVSLQACITLDGSDPNVDASVAVAYRNIPVDGTSYTFNDITADELYAIHYATTGGNSRKVWFKIKTVIGSTTGYSQLERTFTIANPNPVINPTIIDTDSTITAITGNNKTLVRYYSNASVNINAYAVKAATLVSSSVTCGGKSPVNGIIENIESSSFVFSATDNRGNITTKTVTPADGIFSFVDYVKLTCNLSNNMPDSNGNMTIEVAGNYFNGAIGKTNNTLTVKYRYKAVGGSYSSWKTMTADKSGNTYYALAYESDLDHQTAYTFQAYAVDALGSLSEVYTPEITVKSTPVFDWGEYDFKFNVPVYDEFNTIIRNGKAAYTGSGTNAINPNTTLEELCLTDHANAPRPGYWFFIRTMLYTDTDNLTTTAYRAQLAIPAGATMSVYHRTYSVNSGWSTWRRLLNEDEKFTQTKLLWVNASTTSSLANTTLSLDLTDYDLVHIEFLTNCSSGAWKSYRVTMTVPVNHDTEWKNYKAVGYSETGANMAFRAFHMGNNTVRFGESYYAATYGATSLTTNNNLYIPLRIYGVKGVS